jgi:hypothetical protein
VSRLHRQYPPPQPHCTNSRVEINEFNGIVQLFRDLLAGRAAQIEEVKMACLGLRLHLEDGAGQDAEQLQLADRLAERKAELERYPKQGFKYLPRHAQVEGAARKPQKDQGGAGRPD